MNHKQRRRARRRSPIRVGFLAPTLALGGTSRWMTSLARHLPGQSGHRIAVSMIAAAIHAPNSRSQETEGEARAYAPVDHGRKAVEALAAQSDVLLVSGMPNLDCLPPFAGPLVFVGHGHCQWTVEIILACLPRVTHWVAVSQSAAESFPDPSKVTVIHNGVEADRCTPRTSRDVVRAAWGLAADEIAVGYVGRFSPEKNPADCAHAVQVLGSPYRAVYVGDGWRLNQVLREIRQLVPDLVYSPPVLHVGDVLNALECFLLTSPSEGCSLTLAEAWYCQCPTVCTPVGVLTELEPAHGKLAVTVPVGAAPTELAAAVRRAIVPENAAVVVRAARVARERLTAEVMAKHWADHLLSIA